MEQPFIRFNAYITHEQGKKLAALVKKQKKQDPKTSISSVIRRALDNYLSE